YMGAMNSSQIEIKSLANGMGPYMECMPTFVWNKCGRKHPCFRRSQFRLCPENGRISVDIEAMSNNDMLAELQQFPPFGAAAGVVANCGHLPLNRIMVICRLSADDRQSAAG
ncbi:hypothetical protein RU080_18715, partial [Shewanella algae]|uniref:hypothetical protein n=1 Tax=Shewanella algae TaxID=38313 RepID=UPI0029362DD9